MAVTAYCKSLAALGDHAALPFSFTLKVFDLVHMMKFIPFSGGASTQFALLGFEFTFEGIYRMPILKTFAMNVILTCQFEGFRIDLTVVIVGKIPTRRAFLSGIWDSPPSVSVRVFLLNLAYCHSVLAA